MNESYNIFYTNRNLVLLNLALYYDATYIFMPHCFRFYFVPYGNLFSQVDIQPDVEI